MMTGRLPVRGGIGLHQQPNTNGVFTSEAVGGIPQNETTIAEVLSDNGYGTYMVGKVRVSVCRLIACPFQALIVSFIRACVMVLSVAVASRPNRRASTNKTRI